MPNFISLSIFEQLQQLRKDPHTNSLTPLVIIGRREVSPTVLCCLINRIYATFQVESVEY